MRSSQSMEWFSGRTHILVGRLSSISGKSMRYSESLLFIFVLIVLALYSNLSEATQSGTTLWASTSCTVTESLTLLQISSLHLRISRNGEKSVTKSEAPHSLRNVGTVSSASPYIRVWKYKQHLSRAKTLFS